MNQRLLIIAIAAMVIVGIASAHLLHVPADYAKIQLAVNAAVNGDTVVVYPGTYFENVIFRGKKILLTSRYYESGDMSFISSTTINGSQPAFPDTASCVLFINHEDSTAVLQGFTLTGGGGTAWTDEHGAGIYREGGGVLSAFSSPTICHNLIMGNAGINANGNLSSGGGGGMRCGDGRPHILDNVITANKGMYGGAIVLNYCDGAVIKNNIIYLNKVDQFVAGKPTYSGGGIWINDKLSGAAQPHTIENNSIFLNFSIVGTGGAILAENGAAVNIRNNIIWSNQSASGNGPLALSGSSTTLTYNDIDAVTAGTGNITANPAIADSGLYLSASSPCIDAGDSSTTFNDVENPGSLGQAMWPSQGGLRNDIGAYGGKGTSLFPIPNNPSIAFPAASVDFGYVPPPGVQQTMKFYFWNYGTRALRIDSVTYRGNVVNGFSLLFGAPKLVGAFSRDSITISWTPGPSASILMSDTIRIYHNDTAQQNPALVFVAGKSFAIDPPENGVMYAFSGTADSGRMYKADTASGHLTLIGSTNYSDVLSVRTNPVTDELVALAVGAQTQLIRVNSHGAQNTVLSSIGIKNPKGMAFKSDGTLYVANSLGTIYSVDMKTGASTQVVATTIRIAGIAFNPLTGVLWASVRSSASVKDNIYTIDLGTGTTTLVGATGFGVQTKDITFDDNGRLFGIMDSATSAQSYLISINTSDGHGTLIGGLGVSGMEAVELKSYYLNSVQSRQDGIPQKFSLEQNYPNPFNPTTRLRYTIATAQFVRLTLFDLLGREVATLVNERKAPGSYEVTWDASSLASGIYFSRLQAGSFVQTKKMILMK